MVDEFLFLTNEERDITQKIKATDVASAGENKQLSNLIVKDMLRDDTVRNFYSLTAL